MIYRIAMLLQFYIIIRLCDYLAIVLHYDAPHYHSTTLLISILTYHNVCIFLYWYIIWPSCYMFYYWQITQMHYSMPIFVDCCITISLYYHLVKFSHCLITSLLQCYVIIILWKTYHYTIIASCYHIVVLFYCVILRLIRYHISILSYYNITTVLHCYTIILIWS